VIETVRQLLSEFQPVSWGKDLVTAGFVKKIELVERNLLIHIQLPFAGASLEEDIKTLLDERIRQSADIRSIRWTFDIEVAAIARTNKVAGIAGVRNIIAISSGKGGVGKSTTAVNLALALKQEGATVGLLDADIYGPSIPLLLGKAEAHPGILDEKHMSPVSAHGVVCNSIGFLVPDGEAMVWRGPMASKALSQILYDTRWGDLDYLVVDLPPGTGDIQLTIAQQVPTTAAVVITTPQDLALIDARKGIAMFEKVNIPVLGVVENMSYYICSRCGHKEMLFGEGGGAKVAEQYGIELLGQLPLHIDIRAHSDAGKPIVVAQPQSKISLAYRRIARRMASELYFQGSVEPATLFTVNQ
jgi:ATP-binding protein involved in chromosome partitioning